MQNTDVYIYMKTIYIYIYGDMWGIIADDIRCSRLETAVEVLAMDEIL